MPPASVTARYRFLPVRQRLQSIHLEPLIRVHFRQHHRAFTDQVVEVVLGS